MFVLWVFQPYCVGSIDGSLSVTFRLRNTEICRSSSSRFAHSIKRFIFTHASLVKPLQNSNCSILCDTCQTSNLRHRVTYQRLLVKHSKYNAAENTQQECAEEERGLSNRSPLSKPAQLGWSRCALTETSSSKSDIPACSVRTARLQCSLTNRLSSRIQHVLSECSAILTHEHHPVRWLSRPLSCSNKKHRSECAC